MASIIFKLGDLVQLKSGGPKMTVTDEAWGIDDEATIWCTWFAGAKRSRGEFPMGALKPVTDD